MPYYLRKKVKFIDNRWKYIYEGGGKFDKIPDNFFEDRRVVKFMEKWGDGTYEFIRTDKGRKIEKRIKVAKLSFRAKADLNSQPIQSLSPLPPSSPPKQIASEQQTKSSPRSLSKQKIPQPQPEPSLKSPPTRKTSQQQCKSPPSQQPMQKRHKPQPMSPPEQIAPMPSHQQTRPKLMPRRGASKPPQPKPSPMLPSKQRIAQQTQQSPIRPTVPTTRSIPIQSYEQAQPIQAPIKSTSSAPEKSPTPAPKKAPSSELEKRKLEFHRCLKCKIYVKWFRGKDTHICPVCATEYKIRHVCSDCGSKVTPDATRCPNCGEVLEEGEVEEINVICFDCETEVKWDKKKGIPICQGCGFEYIILRACPICRTEVTPEATSCPECSKKLTEFEGEYLYPSCPIHKIPMDYSPQDGFFCLPCLPDPDEEDIEECPECGNKVTDEDSVCPNCRYDLMEDD